MRRASALVICAAVLFGIGGCGGGNDTASTTSSTTQDSADIPQPAPQGPAAADEGPDKQGADSTAKAAGTNAKSEGSARQGNSSEKNALKPVRVPPISSAPTPGSKAPAPGVKTVKGADNSVQEYGVEADESARTQAAVALQAYLNARAEEDWGSACSFLAQRPTEQLERLARSASRQGTDLNGCAATTAFLKEGQAKLREQATITEVLSFRGEGEVSGNPSYLIFAAPPAKTLYSMPMYLEGGGWKVGLARAAELPVG
jgi:hypothetical protein